MNGKVWKELFRQQGWLQGDRIQPPPGYWISILFTRSNFNLFSTNPDHHAQSAGEFIIERNETGSIYYHLWDSITDVNVHKVK